MAEKVGRKYPISDIERIRQLHPPERGIRSATPQEILDGLTTDAYFVGTQQILGHLGKQNMTVTAEVFANEAGMVAGIEEALALLADLPIEVESLTDGDPVSYKEVVMRIRGPYAAFGLYETALLGILASSSGYATATQRVVHAAESIPVYSFGARHVHPAIAPVMDRAALIGGAQGASTILGARQAGQMPAGTMPHALMLMAGDTVEAALAYDQVMPEDAVRTVLVDTFHDEAEEAIRVARALNGKLSAIRLDTPRERGGVTPALVREVKARLGQAGFPHVGIFVSGGLNPERITVLRDAGVTGFGVGSYIAAAAPLDMTMDIKEIDGSPVAKRGRIPGITESPRLVRRFPPV